MNKSLITQILKKGKYFRGLMIEEFNSKPADIYIFRILETETETIGISWVFNKPYQDSEERHTWPQVFFTLELPWKENRRNISRIPPGTYQAKKFQSPRFKREVILLDEVPFRDAIEIHPLNYVHETRGCIGVSLAIDDLNNDGTPDLRYSSYGLDLVLDLVPRDLTITICDYFKKEV